MKKCFFVVLKKYKIILSFFVAMVIIGSIIIIEKSDVKVVESPPSLGITIVLDAGHGGVDPGSIGKGTKVTESKLNLLITKKVESLLKSSGIAVILTRTNDGGLYGIYTRDYKINDMKARRDIINNSKADAVVSIHMNSFIQSRQRGAQTFYEESSEAGRELALAIQKNFSENLPASDKGIAIGDYYILKGTNIPSVLCECGYLSNPEDEKLLVNEEYQDKLAYNIYAGIIAYLNSKM